MEYRPRISSLWSDGSWWARAKPGPKPVCRRLFLLLLLLISALWPASLQAQRGDTSDADDHRFDIGIIIDNRSLPRSDAAKTDVDALFRMLDRQMFIEHIMVFERPTIEVVCDIFGCPEALEDANPFPPLIWQITREREARLFVYYIGDGRLEGLERQLLFRRTSGSREGDVLAFPVEWLHDMLQDARPASAVLMLDTSFSPRPLPCTDEDPRLIGDALLSVRRNYRNVVRDHWNRTNNVELGATTPVQPAHCDRFDLVLDDVEQPLFTKFLLKGIVEGKADQEPYGDEDRLIDLGELTGYLDDRMKRAAQFQWGRLQNVRAVGPRGKVLATLDGRKLSPGNADVVARRNKPPDQDDEPANDGAPITGSRERGASDQGASDRGASDRTRARPKGREAACLDDPTVADCHPCVIDPSGPACAERCRDNGGSGLCAPNLSATTETVAVLKAGAFGIEPEAADEIEEKTDLSTKGEAGEPSLVCRWAADNVSPYAAPLVQRIGGGTQSSCDWATDRSEVELGPFAQIFTPIGWRLGRGSAQDAISCLLDCDEDVQPAESSTSGRPSPALQPLNAPPAQASLDPRSLGAFNREICDKLDEPLPSYIGLPRWMPGTLIISEALRAGYDCPAQPAEPGLPTPIAIAIEAPSETETPTPDPSPAVALTDRKLSKWPPYAVAVDPVVGETNQPVIDEAIQKDSGTGPDVQIADSTPTDSGGSTAEPADLSGETPLEEETFDQSVSKVRWLQSALTVDNRSPGPIDGDLGARTMEAVQSWRRDNKRENRTGPLTEPEFQEIIEEFGQRFGQIEESAPSF